MFLTHLCRLYCAKELLEINPPHDAALDTGGNGLPKKKKLLQWAGPGQDALPSAHKRYFHYCGFQQQHALVGRFGKGRVRNDATSILKVLELNVLYAVTCVPARSKSTAMQTVQSGEGGCRAHLLQDRRGSPPDLLWICANVTPNQPSRAQKRSVVRHLRLIDFPSQRELPFKASNTPGHPVAFFFFSFFLHFIKWYFVTFPPKQPRY